MFTIELPGEQHLESSLFSDSDVEDALDTSTQNKLKTSTIEKTTKDDQKDGTDDNSVPEDIKGEIVEHIRLAHPLARRLLQDLAKRGKVNPKLIKQYWNKMASTKSKSNLSKGDPQPIWKFNSRTKLIRPLRRYAYTEFKRHLKKNYSCKIYASDKS
jgi:hypothetical protein